MSGLGPARACSTCIFICLVAGPSPGRLAETPRRSAPPADPPPRLTLIGPGWYPALRLRARRVSPPCHGHEIRKREGGETFGRSPRGRERDVRERVASIQQEDSAVGDPG